MPVSPRRATAAIAAAIISASLALPVMAQDATEAPAGSPAATGDAWPLTGTLKDGSTFTLKQSTVDKLAAGDAINYLFSYGSDSIPLFSPQYRRGYERSIPEAQAILPNLVPTAIAPASPLQDVNQQIAQIQALWEAGLIDCLSIQSTGTDAFTNITNQIMADGIPVFTVGVQSNGNELSNFTQISLNEGAQAAQIVLDWMEATGNDLNVFAVSGGDPPQNWAQGRMQGFIDGIKAAKPDAVFVNDASTALATTYDSTTTYDAYTALLLGNPDLQFIENVDIGAEHAGRAIVDAKAAGREGDVFTIGWNVSEGQMNFIEQGIQVAALDQKWGDQAAFGAVACADFLKNGVIRPNTQVLVPVTLENLEASREEFRAITGG